MFSLLFWIGVSIKIFRGSRYKIMDELHEILPYLRTGISWCEWDSRMRILRVMSEMREDGQRHTLANSASSFPFTSSAWTFTSPSFEDDIVT